METTEKVSQSQPQPDQNERIMAALSHVAVLLPLMGIIAPIVIWVTQKDKSEYVAFQALQAVAYQMLIILLAFVGMGCYFISIFGTVFSIAAFAPDASGAPPVGFFLPFAFVTLLLCGSFFLTLYGVVGAVLTLQGKDFRYLVLGNWLARYLRTA